MRHPFRATSFFPAMAYALALAATAVSTEAQTAPRFRVLHYGKSPAGAAYVHTNAMAVLKDSVVAWGKTYGFAVDVAADATVMTTANLARYQTIIFDNIPAETSDALPLASQRAALLEYMKTGGFVGTHATAEAARWTEFIAVLGAKMANHTSETTMATATLNADPGAAGHPILTGLAGTPVKMELPAKVVLADEWYTYSTNPRNLSGLKVLYTLDEKTFTPAGTMGDHPITWVREMPQGGRLFYTGSGHHGPYLAQPFIKSLLLNSIFWTAKQEGNTGLGPLLGPGGGKADRAYKANRGKGNGGGADIGNPPGGPAWVEIAGAYRIEFRTLDGRFIGAREGK
jgi:cytochrome c